MDKKTYIGQDQSSSRGALLSVGRSIEIGRSVLIEMRNER
jgi:hypothetical protein